MPGTDEVKPAAVGVKLTYDDFVLFPDDGLRHELIDGEHYVTPSPIPKHQQVSSNLHFFIRLWLEERSEEHTSELSHRCISYAVFCLKKKKEEKLIVEYVYRR